MQELISDVIFPAVGGPVNGAAAEDSAVLQLPEGRVALTTDSYVVKPRFFRGGDIGKISVCGTVNDLSMVGAVPICLTLGLILEEGLRISELRRVLNSVAETARAAGVRVVSGDTKVVERGQADGIYINTAGVGVVPDGVAISITGAVPGDLLIVNGDIGDHGVAVMEEREGFELAVSSDCAPLNTLVQSMLEAGEIHSLRDPTRGGLGAAVMEMATASDVQMELVPDRIPVKPAVRAFCEMLGLDPIFVANEGKLLAAVPEKDVDAVLEAMRAHPLGAGSAVIGSVVDDGKGRVRLRSPLGPARLLRMPSGEQLPRIC